MSDQRFFRVFLLMSLAIPGCRSDAGSSPDLFDGEPWTLSGPTDLQVMHINHEYVWGVERDELDLESIVRYRLVRGA